MAQQRQPPGWWRSEVLGQVAMALLVMVAVTFGAAADGIPLLAQSISRGSSRPLPSRKGC